MKTENELEQQERDEKAETLQAIRKGKRFKNAKTFIEVCRHVITHGLSRYKGMAIDSYSASAFVAVYDKLNPINQEKLSTIANENPSKAMGIIWQLIK